MKVILNALPPTESITISAALSILQSFLKEHEIDVETKYWNVLFDDNATFSNFQEINRNSLLLLPFFCHIGLQFNDKQVLENIENKLRVANPRYENLSKNYYAESMERLSNSVIQTFITELKMMHIEECDLFGISSKFFQWIPGNIVAGLVKQINPNIKIVIGGFGTKKRLVL